MTEDDSLTREDPYFLEVESHFAERRGTSFVFSAKDWVLMKSWKDQGIPLPIVIEAIDACFDKRAASQRKRIISSLSYCRHAVVELWDERRDLRVGGRGAVPERETGSGLDELVSALEACAAAVPIAAIRPAILSAVDRVRSIRATESVPGIEQELMTIEEEMVRAVESALPEDEHERIHATIDAEVAKYRFTDDGIRDRTKRATLWRRLREMFGLPRLSLFG